MSRVPVPRLAAGIHVVPRDDDHLQVGLDPPARVIVRRDPALVAVLDDLAAARAPVVTDPAQLRLLDALAAAGLLERPTVAPRPVPVVVRDLGLGLRLAERLATVAITATPAPPGPARATHETLVVLASPAPLPRADADVLVAGGVAHLVVAGTGRAGRLRVGPLVVPGTTACLRCVDAHEGVHDPRRPLVVEQLAMLPAPPLEPLVHDLAAACAAQQVAAYVAGDRPLTYSASLDLDPTGGARLTRWERHSHCGCAWDQLTA